VDWGAGGSGLSLHLQDVVFENSAAVLNGTDGHTGDGVLGGAVGVILGPDGPVQDVNITLTDCAFQDVTVWAGAWPRLFLLNVVPRCLVVDLIVCSPQHLECPVRQVRCRCRCIRLTHHLHMYMQLRRVLWTYCLGLCVCVGLGGGGWCTRHTLFSTSQRFFAAHLKSHTCAPIVPSPPPLLCWPYRLRGVRLASGRWSGCHDIGRHPERIQCVGYPDPGHFPSQQCCV
jgi:hypothetical protein